LPTLRKCALTPKLDRSLTEAQPNGCLCRVWCLKILPVFWRGCRLYVAYIPPTYRLHTAYIPPICRLSGVYPLFHQCLIAPAIPN